MEVLIKSKKDWSRELKTMEPDKLMDILLSYVDPLKRDNLLLKAVHDILLKKLKN